nr:DNA recombination protein RmuC [Motiliproteus sediminis]
MVALPLVTELLWLGAGVVAGGLVTLLVALLQGRAATAAAVERELGLKVEISRLQERLTLAARLDQQLDESDAEVRALQAANGNLQAELRAAQTRLEEERDKQAEKLALLEQARARMQVEFQQLAQRVLDDTSQRFGAQQQEKMDGLLRPLREQLGEFRRRVDDVYDKEAKDRRGLQEQVEQLKQLNLRMSQDAVNLTNALKGENKTQGNWGEVILERVLAESGLRRGHEYEVQASARDASGARFQPDVIVHLPEGKDVIIDAKVTLVAYERYACADNDADANAALRDHLQSVRRHIKGLSSKSYADLDGVRSLDFVLLFVPIESAFMLAIEQDRQLFAEAFSQNILLVSPSTLLVTLRTIHHIWRNEKQNRHALEIARQGGELYDKFVGFVDALEEIGRHLDAAQRAYDTSHKRLTSGRGSLVNRVQGLTALGVQARKKLSDSVLDASDRDSAAETIKEDA